MEPPPVRYVHTGDGVSVAYSVFGEGPPLFYAFAGPGLSCFEFEWTFPPLVEQYERIAQERTLVRFDWRNTGLSTRGVEDVGPAAHLRDLLTLQDHLEFDRVALRVHGSAKVALRYAAMHPHRVSSLILSSPSVAPVEPDQPRSVTQQLLSLAADADWRLFANLLAVSLAGWEGPERTWFAKWVEAATEKQDFFETLAAASNDDVMDLLPEVDCPVLIVQRKEPPSYFFVDVDARRHLADSRLLTRDLPASRLVLLEGSSMMITTDPASTSALLGFLREVDPGEPAGGESNLGPSIRTIMFTDLEGHTEMMQRLGDETGRETLRVHERITRSALAAHGGGEVKAMGDGFLASFASAQQALDCAVALQRELASVAGEPLSVRIGINAGEPIEEDSDLFGASVIAAARVADRAIGRQVLVTDVVRQLVTGKGFRFGDAGEQMLKGIAEPAHLWELDWEAVEPTT
jgi:class 3 adenylate cyclase